MSSRPGRPKKHYVTTVPMATETSSTKLATSLWQETCRISIVDVNLDGLCAAEQDHIRKVLNKAISSDEMVSKQCWALQSQLHAQLGSKVATKTKKSSSSSSSTRHDPSTTARTGASCCRCGGTLDQLNGDNTTCRECTVRWRYALVGGLWRDSQYRVRLGSKSGWGLVMVGGLSSSGGVLRTYVCQVMAGGAAERAGVRLGDEVMSWGLHDFVGATFSRVTRTIRYYRPQDVQLSLRRMSKDGSFEQTEAYLVQPQIFGKLNCPVKTLSMVCDPAKLNLPNTTEAELSIGKGHIFRYGRVQISLTKVPQSCGLGLSVEVLRANYLPPNDKNQQPLSSTTVQLRSSRRLVSRSTKVVGPTFNPAWYERLHFDTVNLQNDSLKITVMSEKKWSLLGGTKPVSVVIIVLNEARVDATPQWYTMYSMEEKHPVSLSRPSDIALDDMFLQHRSAVMPTIRQDSLHSGSEDDSSPYHSQARPPVATNKEGRSRGKRAKLSAIAKAAALTEKVRGKRKKRGEMESKPSADKATIKGAVSAPNLLKAVEGDSPEACWDAKSVHDFPVHTPSIADDSKSTDNLYSDSDTGHTLGESPAESLNSLILKTPSISDIELMSIEDKRCEQFAHLQDKKYTQSCSHDDVIVEVGSPSHQRHGRNTHTTIISPNRDYRWLKKPLQKFGHKLKRGFIPDTPQFLSAEDVRLPKYRQCRGSDSKSTNWLDVPAPRSRSASSGAVRARSVSPQPTWSATDESAWDSARQARRQTAPVSNSLVLSNLV